MNELALFAGIGGGVLGTKLLGFTTKCYVEWDKYCIKILKARIRDGIFDDAPIWDDVGTFDGKPWRNHIDIITAGFPCQPFSVAGKQGADMDGRNMWPSTLRIIEEVRPQWILLENVPGLLSESHGYFGQILKELDEIGYNARWGCLSASTVGAPHKRERLWVVAHANSKRLSFSELWKTSRREKRHEKLEIKSLSFSPWSQRPCKVTDFPRMDDGIPDRINRLKSLGNGQVPAVVATAFKILSE